MISASFFHNLIHFSREFRYYNCTENWKQLHIPKGKTYIENFQFARSLANTEQKPYIDAKNVHNSFIAFLYRNSNVHVQ